MGSWPYRRTHRSTFFHYTARKAYSVISVARTTEFPKNHAHHHRQHYQRNIVVVVELMLVTYN